MGKRSARQRVRAGRGDDLLGNPILHVVEAIETRTLEFDDVTQGASVELHVGEVLEQDVYGSRKVSGVTGDTVHHATSS